MNEDKDCIGGGTLVKVMSSPLMDVTTMIPTRKKETCWPQNSTCSEEGQLGYKSQVQFNVVLSYVSLLPRGLGIRLNVGPTLITLITMIPLIPLIILITVIPLITWITLITWIPLITWITLITWIPLITWITLIPLITMITLITWITLIPLITLITLITMIPLILLIILITLITLITWITLIPLITMITLITPPWYDGHNTLHQLVSQASPLWSTILASLDLQTEQATLTHLYSYASKCYSRLAELVLGYPASFTCSIKVCAMEVSFC